MFLSFFSQIQLAEDQINKRRSSSSVSRIQNELSRAIKLVLNIHNIFDCNSPLIQSSEKLNHLVVRTCVSNPSSVQVYLLLHYSGEPGCLIQVPQVGLVRAAAIRPLPGINCYNTTGKVSPLDLN